MNYAISTEELGLLLTQEKVVEHLFPYVELKEIWEKDYGQKLSGLANKYTFSHQFLVVGVKDKTGKLVGHTEKDAHAIQNKISQQVNALLRPIQACEEIFVRELGTAWVVIVKLSNPGVPVYWDGKVFSIVGATKRELLPNEILDLAQSLPGLRDATAKTTDLTSLDVRLAKEFLEKIRDKQRYDFHNSESSPEEGLQSLGIRNKYVSQLLFGKTPYRVVRFDGSLKPTLNETRFGLYGLVRDEFVQDISNWVGDDTIQLPLKEALANAVAHAAYFDQTGDIVVETWPGKIQISNLCIAEAKHFANKWFSKSHASSNKLLAETLRLAGVVDELGIGKKIIFAECIKRGLNAPIVEIEPAGTFFRWRLTLFCGEKDATYLRLFDRLQAIFQSNSEQALVALALVKWSNHPVSDIRHFLDAHSVELFTKVISDFAGPVFYYKEQDRLTLRRWAEVLLNEGKDSKVLSREEENSLKDFLSEMIPKYHGGILTPEALRKFANMGNTNSEKSLANSLLRKWTDEQVVARTSRGKYSFLYRKPQSFSGNVDLGSILRRLAEANDSA